MNRDFNSAIVNDVAHRPWPMPNRPWVMTQTWHDLLFAHWAVEATSLRSKVPAAFELDLYKGTAWVAVVPFRMTNVAPRGVPALPWVSEFPELNVRTYVRVADRPGIYFFSLDAGSGMAVFAARTLFNLPYYTASMDVAARAHGIDYRSSRALEPAELIGTYRPVGPAFQPSEGTLEYFLTERYCLYHADRHGEPYRLEIHHPRWQLHVADATLVRNTIATPSGIALAGQPQLLHFAKRQDAVAWLPTKLR